MIKKLSIFLFIFIIGIAFIIPKSTNAQTIQQFEDEVAKYTAQLQAKKNAIAKNDQEVAEIEEKIKSIQSEIKTLQQEITNLQAEIDKANIEIEKKTAQSKKLIEYYQVSNGENSYLEYVFGATSITDMIYRISVVEQLTEYNDNLMKELQNLIEQNKIRQTELDQKQKDLNAKQKELEEEQAKIEKDTAAIKESMPSVEQQIKSAQANVKYYKALGCGQNEDILQCQYRIEQARSSSSGGSSGGGSIPSTNGFYRPMEYGYVTQGYGGYGGHLGVDLSSSNKSIPIYPIANGQVFFKGYDCYGALVVKIKHNYNGRYIYSTYAHMRSFGNISKGQYISYATSIGNMGSTGWSTGPHLHLEITTCDWNAGGGCSYATYKKSTINPFSLISIPSRWTNR
ncbi:MAG: peptidoglycan DD-metalloendopeptidase family protein [Bacilli bacterium]|nr:peptidoglycan DD-metalloendopeptidase family protein [Bacilli bacterium]